MSADTTPPPPRHKELLDEWISNNYEEYCDFTEMMHSVDGIGFERVFRACLKTIVNRSEFSESNYNSRHHEHFVG